MKEYDLKKIQEIQLDITLEVIEICEKHNINFFIIAGTLLGAVRHKGFIPWDDDMDIGMLREDYEKFINICKNELSEKYFLQTMYTEKSFVLPIAKVRKNDSTFIEKNSKNVNIHNGIFIDVFPFDNVPNNFLKRKVQSTTTYILKRLLLIKVGYKLWDNDDFIKKQLYKIIKLISNIIPLKLQKTLLMKSSTKYNTTKTDEVVAIGGAYNYKKETIKREWINELILVKFENAYLPAPLLHEKYLTHFYGNYLIPPPINERYNRHGIIKVRYGK